MEVESKVESEKATPDGINQINATNQNLVSQIKRLEEEATETKTKLRKLHDERDGFKLRL